MHELKKHQVFIDHANQIVFVTMKTSLQFRQMITLNSSTSSFTSLNQQRPQWVVVSILSHIVGTFDLFLTDFAEYSKQQVVTQTKFLSRLGVHHDAAVLAIQSQTQATVYCFV